MESENHDLVGRADAVVGLREAVEALSDLFRRRLMEDKARNSLYEALIEQVQEQRRQLQQRDLGSLISESLIALDRLRHEPVNREIVESVLAEVFEVYRRRGLEDVSEGDEFDPSVHEVVDTVPAHSDSPPGTVVRIHRPGYRFGGRLLRPAQVTLAVAPSTMATDIDP